MRAIVIGSGPGGSMAADVLSAAGWSVVLFEKGRNHLIEPDGEPKADYTSDELKFVHRHFLGPDPITEPRSFRPNDAAGERSFVGEVNSIPSSVGGGGTHADGKTPRFLEVDFKLRSAFGPQPDADVADWPLTYAELEPFYAEVERAIGVAGDADANPFAAWRSGPFPMPPGAPMYFTSLTVPAAERLGYHPYVAPTAANSVPYDDRPACNNCGMCAFFGCPIHAKGDPVALLRRALKTGFCELRPETFVSRIRVKNGRAEGVDYIGPDGVERSMDADHVVLAGGAIETPRLLLLSGIGGDLVGSYLMCHFQTLVAGDVAERLHGHRGRSVTHVHDDAIIGDDASAAAAREAGLPWLRGGMVEHATPNLPVVEAQLYRPGAGHARAMKESRLRERLACFVMQGEDLPYRENRIDLDPLIKDVRGFPVARMTYEGKRHELVSSAHHGPRLEAILKEMGASWTSISTSPGVSLHGGLTAAPESRHVMGTARMGTNPKSSVCDPYGVVHGVENLVVADSSVFVTSTGYGPTLTLVALAARAARALLSRG